MRKKWGYGSAILYCSGHAVAVIVVRVVPFRSERQLEEVVGGCNDFL